MVTPTLHHFMRDMSASIAESPLLVGWPEDERSHQARREVEALLMDATGWSRLDLAMRATEPIESDIVVRVEDQVARRVNGEPLAYILGYADFLGHRFCVTPDCLIPRPDTEILVDVCQTWLEEKAVPGLRLVDIGTGSGCIAVSIALTCDNAVVTAVDISAEALHIARINAERLGANISFVHADGISWLMEQKVSTKPHVILSNPPYIPSNDVDELEPVVRDYEPRLALDGGDDGLHVYRAFAELSPCVLADTGPAGLFFEVGLGQAASVATLFQTSEWASFTVSVHQDLRGVDRVVSVVRSRN